MTSSTLTLDEILELVRTRRPCSYVTLRRWLRKLNIRPQTGAIRTKPLRYSPDTPQRLMEALGEKVVTMPQLRAERAKAQKARAA